MIKSLPVYMTFVNNQEKEDLWRKSPFEDYFGRQSKKLVRSGMLENHNSLEVTSVLPLRKDLDNYVIHRCKSIEHTVKTFGTNSGLLQKKKQMEFRINEKGLILKEKKEST